MVAPAAKRRYVPTYALSILVGVVVLVRLLPGRHERLNAAAAQHVG